MILSLVPRHGVLGGMGGNDAIWAEMPLSLCVKWRDVSLSLSPLTYECGNAAEILSANEFDGTRRLLLCV